MIALYIHWPFCISKCPYCDFNSHVRDAVDHKRWKLALLKELGYYAEQTAGRRIQSIFFGGGTPSLMDPDVVASLIEQACSLWNVAPSLEITLEANPGTVDMNRFQSFREAGVNRISLGVQSFDDDQLRFLGRKHTARDSKVAIEIAHKTFPQYSFDLIYARPEQTCEQWHRELNEALELAGDHLSLYQLTIEPGTSFYTQHNRGEFQIPRDDRAADLYTLTDKVMRSSGRPSYEVSNYARPGHESRHNLMYWEYGDYVGVGPGAHGRLTKGNHKYATRGVRAPELWLKKVEKDGHGAAESVEVPLDQQVQESLMMGLRLDKGISIVDFERKFDTHFEQWVSMPMLNLMENEGLLKFQGQHLHTSLPGRLCLNKILEALLI